MRCSEQVGDPGQVAWYHVRTNKIIKSGKRFELTGLSMKITDFQPEDAGTYECRGVSNRQYLTIYVNGEFSICTFCSSFRHHDVSWLILLLRVSLGDHQEWVFILPVSLKLVQFEVSTLKSEEVHIF